MVDLSIRFSEREVSGSAILAIIIGDLGSEKALVKELRNLGIRTINSLADVEEHLRSSASKIENLKREEKVRVQEDVEAMKSKHEELMAERMHQQRERLDGFTATRDSLRKKVEDLSEKTKNPFKFMVQTFRIWRIKRQINMLEDRFDEEVDRPIKKLKSLILELEERISYLECNIQDEVHRRLASQIEEKKKIDKSLEHLRTWVLGARGEKEVVLALADLPESFFVVNDFVLRLEPPLKAPTGLRFQCQADHIVVGPSGVFVIETKFWSSASIQSLDLNSPVEQIKLTGKGLWRELNRAISNGQIKVNEHHWGDTSIQVRNILAMVGAMPNSDFQFVRVLPVERLREYLQCLEPKFQKQEIESIANWLVRNLPSSEKRTA